MGTAGSCESSSERKFATRDGSGTRRHAALPKQPASLRQTAEITQQLVSCGLAAKRCI